MPLCFGLNLKSQSTLCLIKHVIYLHSNPQLIYKYAGKALTEIQTFICSERGKTDSKARGIWWKDEET